MNRTIPKRYEDLLKRHYGTPPKRSPRNVQDTTELFAAYYGKPLKPAHAARHHHRNCLSLHGDDGERLLQHSGNREYVVGSAPERPDQPDVAAPAVPAPALSLSVADVLPSQEYSIDVRDPFRDSSPEVLDARYTPVAGRSPQDSPTLPNAASVSESLSARVDIGATEVTEDDFITDMKAILSGQTAYDPVTKKTVPKDRLDAGARSDSGNPPPPAQTANEQAIFDRIAQSMQHANAYDLGTVELQNRFADFDRIHDLQQKAAQQKRPAARLAYGADASNAEFLEDLEAIRSAPRPEPVLASEESTDRWDRIATEVFGRPSYEEFLKDLKSCTFLGRTLNNLHEDTVQMLSVVEKDLLASQGSNYSAPPVSSTLRRKSGMHGWGMAIDFDVLHNPYVLNENGEKELDAELATAYDHICDFILGRPRSVLRKLTSGRSAFGNAIAGTYDALKEESDAMKRYFALKDDDSALAQFLATEWPSKHSTPAPAAADAKSQMVEDFEVLGGATSSGGKRGTGGKGDRPFAPSSGGGVGDPAGGFLNLPREFVIAMTDAGFAWGAVDIAGEPGDIQHFDLRLKGNGAEAYKLLLKYR